MDWKLPTVFLLFLSTVLFTQEPAPTSIIKGKAGILLDMKLADYVKRLMHLTDNQASVSIGVTKGNEIIYAKSFGYADIENGIPANLNTVYHIASLSKPFTAAAIAKLVQQGKVQLDDRLIDHLPTFKMQGEDYKTITIRQVLTHTSGIPRHISSNDWADPLYGPQSDLENLWYCQQYDLDFKPGSEYDYSNSAFDILGVLIAKVSGMPYTDYLKEHILEPAGMTNSTMDKPPYLPNNWALPYSYGSETMLWWPYPYTRKGAPSSGLHTSILDMCQWGLIHLNGGSFGESKMLEKEFFELMVTPQFDTPWGDKIGLSWYLQSYGGHANYMHLGADTGFGAQIMIFPEQDISIIVMANRDFSREGRIALATAEALFGMPMKDYKISARFPFGKALREGGIAKAKEKWQQLEADTTDVYYTDIDDILTTASVLRVLDQPLQAESVLAFYLEKNQKLAYAWYSMGEVYKVTGRLTEAKKYYQKALEVKPGYKRAKEALKDTF